MFISYIRIIDINLPDIRFETRCSSGTYIRTLCADIGNTLGCGGHLKALKRIECGGFDIADAVSMSEIETCQNLEALKHRLVPMSDALYKVPLHIANDDLTEKVKHGKPLAFTDIQVDIKDAGSRFIKIIDNKNQLLAVVSPDEGNDRYNYCCVFHKP